MKGEFVVTPLEGIDFRALKYKESIGFPCDKRLVVFCTQPIHGFYNSYEVMRRVLRVVDGLPGHEVVVKVHPNENPKTYRAMLKNFGYGNVLVLHHADLYELIRAASSVIVITSSVGFESILVGTPVIVFPYDKLFGREFNLVPGAFLGACDEKGLKRALLLLLDEKSREVRKLRKKMRATCRKINFKCDGKATERLVDLVEKMVGV